MSKGSRGPLEASVGAKANRPRIRDKWRTVDHTRSGSRSTSRSSRSILEATRRAPHPFPPPRVTPSRPHPRDCSIDPLGHPLLLPPPDERLGAAADS